MINKANMSGVNIEFINGIYITYKNSGLFITEHNAMFTSIYEEHTQMMNAMRSGHMTVNGLDGASNGAGYTIMFRFHFSKHCYAVCEYKLLPGIPARPMLTVVNEISGKVFAELHIADLCLPLVITKKDTYPQNSYTLQFGRNLRSTNYQTITNIDYTSGDNFELFRDALTYAPELVVIARTYIEVPMGGHRSMIVPLSNC